MNNLEQVAVHGFKRCSQDFMAPNHFRQAPLEYAKIQRTIAAHGDGLVPGCGLDRSLLSEPDSFLGVGQRSSFSADARSDHLGSFARFSAKPFVKCGDGEVNQSLGLGVFAIGNYPLSFQLLIRDPC
jgi:hypothetical protein